MMSLKAQTTPQVIRYAHVCIEVEDLQRTISFYHLLLGTHVVHDFQSKNGFHYGVLLKIVSGVFIEVFLKEAGKRKGKNLNTPIRHFCFQVNSLDAFIQKAENLGLKAKRMRGRTDKTLQFTISDPDGIEIEFHEYDMYCVQSRHTDTSG